MGCSPDQKIIIQPTKQHNENALTIPTSLITASQNCFKNSLILQNLLNPPEIYTLIVDFAIQQHNNEISQFAIEFEDDIEEISQLKLLTVIEKTISALIRKMSNGVVKSLEQDGVGYRIVSTDYLYLQKLSQLKEVLAENYSQKFIEIIFDPIGIPAAEMTQFLTNFSEIKNEINQIFNVKLEFIRKINEFSVIFVAFDQNLVSKCWEERQLFFTNLLFTDQMRVNMEKIMDQLKVNDTQVSFTVSKEVNKAFLSLFSQILSIQFQQLRQYQFIIVDDKLELIKCDEEYKRSYNELYEYIVSLMPQSLQFKIKSQFKLETAKVATEVEVEFIDQVVDQAIQQYLFSNQSVINVEIAQFNQEKIQVAADKIKREIENQLLGNDKCDLFENEEQGNLQLLIIRNEKSTSGMNSGLI